MAEEESFFSHLIELRDRIIRSLIVVLILFGVCFYFSSDIMRFLSQPLMSALPAGSAPIVTDVAAQFFAQTKVAFLTALLLALPWVLYQAWSFVAPGLYEHEKRFALPLIVSSVFFLCTGIGFAYLFVLPAAYKFFISFVAPTGATVQQNLKDYWDFTLAIFFGFGLTFEVPVVEMLLVKLGMVTQTQLREARRYVIVGAFIVAAVLTPPDALSQFMLAVPLVLLYELGIWLAGFITARSRAPKTDEVSDAPVPDPSGTATADPSAGSQTGGSSSGV
jgi:sec-independent protein translocase protein TatC